LQKNQNIFTTNKVFVFRNSDNIQQCLSLAVPLKHEDNQQNSDSPTNSSNASSSRRQRQHTMRKRQHSVHHRKRQQQQKGPQSYIQVTAEALNRFQQQFSGLILSGLGLTNRGKQNLVMQFSPFSSFSRLEFFQKHALIKN